MNKKATWGSIFGALAGIAAAIVAAKQPHHSGGGGPVDPPAVPVYTLTVHVCASDCTKDEKLPGASVEIPGQPVIIADGAGNGFLPNLPAGLYHVCGSLTGYKQTCIDHHVPADGDVFLALERDIPPILPLHADGKIFRLPDGTPWRYKGVSAFALLARYARGEDLQPFLDAYQGYNVLRVWPYVPAADWGASAWSVTDPATIRDFLAAMAAKGWRVELTLLTDDAPDRLVWAKALVPQLTQGGCPPGLLLEAGNEPRTHKAIDTAALRSVLDASGCLYASGDYEDSARAYGLYGTFHSSRDSEWPRRIHDALEYFGGGGPNGPSDPAHRYPWVGDEPQKLEDVSGDRAKDWRAYFGACAVLAGGCTFHSQTGKFAQPPTAEEAQLAHEALAAMDAFPADAPLGAYSRPDDASLRTYIVGGFIVRIRPTGPMPSGWTAIDRDGILGRR